MAVLFGLGVSVALVRCSGYWLEVFVFFCKTLLFCRNLLCRGCFVCVVCSLVFSFTLSRSAHACRSSGYIIYVL